MDAYRLRPVTQAICPPTCGGLQTTSVKSLEGQDCSGLLLGDQSGLITIWGVKKGRAGSHEGARVHAELLLSGHDAAVTTLATAFPGNTGTPLIVSISADGMACAWHEAGASCLMRQHLTVLPSEGCMLLPDGHHLCFSCRLPPHHQQLLLRPPASTEQHPAPHLAGSAALAQRLLAVLEPLSLAIKGLMHPVSMQPLGLASADGRQSPGNLALKILALPTKTIALGVSTDGQLVTWDFSRLAAVAEGQPLSPPTSPPLSPRAPPCPSPRLHSAALPGSLVGASFSEDSSLLLLVCSGGWALLHAAQWDGQDVPAYSHVLHTAHGSESAGGSAEVAAGQGAKLAGGALLSGALAADRTRSDHYYAGVGPEGPIETLVLWYTDGAMAFLQVACASDPPLIQTVAVVPPAGSPCSCVDIAFLGSSRVVRLCSFAAEGGGDFEGCATAPLGPELTVFALPYLFPNMAGRQEGFPVTLEPEAQAASLGCWGDAWGCVSPEAGSKLGMAAAAGSPAGGVCTDVTEPCVTVTALAGSNSYAAEYLAQGMSDGSVLLWPLLSYALPHSGGRSPCAQLRGHSGMVTCLLEHRIHRGDGTAGLLLLSGASDGSVCGWDLESQPVGRRVFSLHLHTDQVLQLLPAPTSQPPPWDACLASIGADGMVALLSLPTGRRERLLHSPPGCLPHTLAWDLGRGYLAAMCVQRGGAEWGWGSAGGEEGEVEEGGRPVFVLWDVSAGSQDRVVVGGHAAAAMQTFLNGLSMAQHHPTTPSVPSSRTLRGGNSTAGPRVSSDSTELPASPSPRPSPFAPQRPFITASSVPHHTRGEGGVGKCLLAHSVLLMDIDVPGLLHSREPLAGLAPKRPSIRPRWPKDAAKQAQQERLPAISALDLRSSTSRASLDLHSSVSRASVDRLSAAQLSDTGGSGRSTPAAPAQLTSPTSAAGLSPSSQDLLSWTTQPPAGGTTGASTAARALAASGAAQQQQQQQQQQQRPPLGHRMPFDGTPPTSPHSLAPMPPTPAMLSAPHPTASPNAVAAMQQLLDGAGAQPTLRSPSPTLRCPSPLSSSTPCSPTAPPEPTSPPPATRPAASLDAALLLALALLHCWGLDADADTAMLRMLCRFGVQVSASAPAASHIDGGGWQEGAATPPGQQGGEEALDLVQPVWRDHDCFCMECPLRVVVPRYEGSSHGGVVAGAALLRSPSPSVSSTGGESPAFLLGPSPRESSDVRVNIFERAEQDRQGGGAPACGPGHELWCRDSRFVAERLLSIVALAKKMMSRHMLEEDVCNPCSALVTFYTLRIPELLPHLATPDVGLYAAHWQDSNDCVRQAARALMAAATDPSLVSAGGLPPEIQAFEALWAGSGGTPSPDHLQHHSAELLCCAAACLYHDKLMPERLFSITVPCLARLVFHAPSPLSAVAASMLAEGLASPAAHHWKQFLGEPLPTFLNKVYQLADRLAALSAGLAHAPPHHAHAHRPQSHPHGKPQHGNGRHNGHHHGQPPGASPARIRPHSPHVPAHAREGGPGGAGAAGGAVQGVDGGVDPGAKSVMACRDGLGALLSALASLDLQLFLNTLWQRLSGDAPPASPTHLLSFTALIRFMHSARGHQQVAAHLPLLVESVMKGMDTSHSALRRACIGGVTAVIKELCMRYPHVCYHADSAQLAVAAPEVRQARGLPDAASTGSLSSSSSHGGPAGEESAGDPVAVYDLDTGHKTFLLRIDLPQGQAPRAQPGGLAAVCFSSHGDYLMGYSDEEGVALGWRLQRGWAHRLHRAPTVLGPAKMVVVPAAAALRGMHQTPQGSVPLGYSIKFETSGRLRLAHHDVVLYVDLDHA